jgi:hypothetical protein
MGNFSLKRGQISDILEFFGKLTISKSFYALNIGFNFFIKKLELKSL